MDILLSFSKSLTDIVLFIHFSNAEIIPEISSPPQPTRQGLAYLDES